MNGGTRAFIASVPIQSGISVSAGVLGAETNKNSRHRKNSCFLK